MKEEALEYLNDYLTNPVFPELDDLQSTELQKLPDWWKSVLSAGDRLKAVMNEWKWLEDVLPNTVRFIGDHLKMVELLRHDKGYSLLYGVECNGEMAWFEGRNPLTAGHSGSPRNGWNNVPQELRQFYSNFHNGWFYVADESGGPYPMEAMFYLGDQEWAILDEIETPVVNLPTTLALFGNGGGGFLCLDVARPANVNEAIVWWDDESPRLNENFWAVLDEWMRIGMEEL